MTAFTSATTCATTVGYTTMRDSTKNDSIAALSPAAPTLPIDPTMRWRLIARRNFRLRN